MTRGFALVFALDSVSVFAPTVSNALTVSAAATASGAATASDAATTVHAAAIVPDAEAVHAAAANFLKARLSEIRGAPASGSAGRGYSL